MEQLPIEIHHHYNRCLTSTIPTFHEMITKNCIRSQHLTRLKHSLYTRTRKHYIDIFFNQFAGRSWVVISFLLLLKSPIVSDKYDTHIWNNHWDAQCHSSH